ncbi:PCI domain-containing protein, putative [Pediculus humanus corporis]|uniref:PCI domain-containing protein 2 homolog n=1 Tax=Pediculus humanus subsp. corporis TaxID=121224 RepID=E0VF01_PEDHC|nr:PCI domain-containing protein, putative [Pediculus humanus corporis]EEB11975.1 PCI domain-containing protein, putative [Pediculus humanus corporis]
MNDIGLTQYLQLVDDGCTYKQGELLAALLSFRHSHASSKKLRPPNMETTVSRILDSPYDELVILHLKCLSSLENKNFLDAFENQFELTQTFVKIFQTQREENWMLKVMQTVCLELRLLASPADKEADNKKHPIECLEKTAKSLMACFRICAADNRSSEIDTKKWGMLTLVNQMFKVYFKINRHQLCKPLMRAIDSCNLKDKFALAQIITYKFFAGLKAMFDGDFRTANECLSFAFLKCHKNSTKNKRSILLYLVPVKMILGYMPKKSLLEKYNLIEFWEVVEAVKMGNLQKFNEVMDRYHSFFIQHNIYVIMQRLSTIATRNLFKKVYHIVNSHQIPVEMFLKALLAMKIEDATWDEAECLLANLILEGKVKGYISYQHDTLVVSKLMPFPTISSIS